MRQFRLSLLFILLVTGFSHGRYFNTVVIDPGHGGRDGGAYWGGVKESDLNLVVAHKLAYELKARGIKTVMTRHKDVNVSKDYRARISNKYRNAIFVSIHFNASTNTTVKGVETYYISSEGRKMADQVQKRLYKSLKCKNRGVKVKGVHVLKATNAPTIIVECGFNSNPS